MDRRLTTKKIHLIRKDYRMQTLYKFADMTKIFMPQFE